ncbi:MAG: rhodanese-like domain-containing protein [Nocardioidaceae bacterium]|nr:rhodanese-like domain-containing protein [Nocardioidaceae bacterium]
MSYGAIPSVGVTDIPDPLPPNLSVLDVREELEWRHGHIDGATHIPLRDLPGRIADVPAGRVLVVCKVGARSARAVQYLQAAGHDAVNLDGGMLDWADARRPMVNDLEGPSSIM